MTATECLTKIAALRARGDQTSLREAAILLAGWEAGIYPAGKGAR